MFCYVTFVVDMDYLKLFTSLANITHVQGLDVYLTIPCDLQYELSYMIKLAYNVITYVVKNVQNAMASE
jgi:2-keto-3-deoxy-L-rhamnonate aldolase RhmA